MGSMADTSGVGHVDEESAEVDMTDEEFEEEILLMLNGGEVFTTVSSSGRRTPKMVYVDTECANLVLLNSNRKTKRERLVPVTALEEVKIGMRTKTFKKNGTPDEEDCYFSLVTKERRTFDFVAPSSEERDSWATAFQKLIVYVSRNVVEEADGTMVLGSSASLSSSLADMRADSSGSLGASSGNLATTGKDETPKKKKKRKEKDDGEEGGTPSRKKK